MEILTARFPHLSEMIFDHLDNRSLDNCKVVSKTWSIYIEEQKFYGIRVIKKIVFKNFWGFGHEKFHKLSKPWFEVLKKGSTDLIMQLRKCFDQFEGRLLLETVYINREVTPLHVSAGAGNILLYESILRIAKNKQPRTEDGFEPIIYAINNHRVKMALFIIERMVDKNPEAKNGWTALDIAARYGNVKICEPILKHSIRTLNYIDGSPLQKAAIFGHIRVCELFMNKTVEKNPGDNEGWTTFHFAALHGRLNICELLMKTIGDRHPRTDEGDTPLHLAALNGHMKICILILQSFKRQKFASFKSKNPRNHDGKTPLAIARENNHFKVSWILEKIWNCVT